MKQKDPYSNETIESEETTAPEDKMVASSRFQCEEAGSSPAGNTNNWFTIRKNIINVAGGCYSRLSVL